MSNFGAYFGQQIYPANNSMASIVICPPAGVNENSSFSNLKVVNSKTRTYSQVYQILNIVEHNHHAPVICKLLSWISGIAEVPRAPQHKVYIVTST